MSYRLSIIISAVAVVSCAAQSQLPLAGQGSFFVGGEMRAIDVPAMAQLPSEHGEITVDQMYVQFQIPRSSGRAPSLVLVHGCCLSGKTWETTPDGRAGWRDFFLAHGYAVYLVDQSARARSGFDPTQFYKVQSGDLPAANGPAIGIATHALAWTAFRFGPRFGEAFQDEKFPVEARQEFFKQLVPDLSSTLSSEHNPTLTNLASLGKTLGGAIFIGHSQSGFFPQQAALIDAKAVRGIVSIEPTCRTDLAENQLNVLARIPTLVVFGDHLEEGGIRTNSGMWRWSEALATCRRYSQQIGDAGGHVEILYLPERGIHGNSHMVMQDSNSDEVAGLVLSWMHQIPPTHREQ